ncbi:alpha/beta-hydrolase [Hymenopellis radicata]|nr:alpha/beta-hydrolase [Hymenopellis radicata]
MVAEAVNAGLAFISADYRLIPSGGITGRDILQDVKDAFAFVGGRRFTHPATGAEYTIDSDSLAAAGTSSGGLCAYLAAIHAVPQPKAIVSMYGMGGDFLTPHYLEAKTEIFFRGREMLDPADPKILPSDLATPNYPANPRMQLTRLYLQLGVFLDYYTGQPNTTAIDEGNKELFPEANISSSWPPTLFVHGDQDTAVPVGDSKNLHRLLLEAGAHSELVVVPGCEHSFDYVQGNEEKFGTIFERVISFLKERLIVPSGNSP